MSKIKTCDPHVFILEKREGYVKYERTDGLIWEVIGICDPEKSGGKCYEEAVGPKPELDCPVAPGFKGCCPLEINVLKEVSVGK